MKHKILRTLIFATVVLSSTVASNGESPKGWFAAGVTQKTTRCLMTVLVPMVETYVPT
jgi:hypothetical protein